MVRESHGPLSILKFYPQIKMFLRADYKSTKKPQMAKAHADSWMVTNGFWTRVGWTGVASRYHS